MNTTPVIIATPREDPKCPSCNKDEKIIKICKHCGHEYKNEPITFLEAIIGILIILFGSWFVCTIGCWLIINPSNDSLFEIIQGQWEWLKEVRIY